MKWSRTLSLLVLLNVCQAEEGLFDSDLEHPWNRLHRQLHTRTLSNGKLYAPEGLEPNFVRRAEFLTQGESHREAIQLLDDFLEHDAGKLIADPLKRAVLQRDLWAIFVTVTNSRLSQQPITARVAEESGAGHAASRPQRKRDSGSAGQPGRSREVSAVPANLES